MWQLIGKAIEGGENYCLIGISYSASTRAIAASFYGKGEEEKKVCKQNWCARQADIDWLS